MFWAEAADVQHTNIENIMFLKNLFLFIRLLFLLWFYRLVCLVPLRFHDHNAFGSTR